MDKKTLIDSILARSERAMPRSHVELVLRGLERTIQAELAGSGSFALPEVGRFSVATRAARKGRNPATGEEVSIPEKRVVKFRPFKGLQEGL